MVDEALQRELAVRRSRARRGAAAALYSMFPLFAAYEWSLRAGNGGYRNASELLLSRPLEPLGDWAPVVRLGGLFVLAVLAAAHLRVRRDWPLVRGGLGIALEGVLWAFALGPLILLVLSVLGDAAPVLRLAGGPPEHLPGLQRIAYRLGAAAWEELFFRLGLYSLFYLLARRVVMFLGAAEGVASWVGEGAGLALSSLAFAGFHLASFTGWLGIGGEAWDPGLFLWRLVAGLLLGVLFRLRGAGATAWAHGVFNGALELGAGPAAFL